MRPSRRTQPYRARSGRSRSAALASMKRGRPRYKANPMDSRRRLQKRRPKRLSQIIK